MYNFTSTPLLIQNTTATTTTPSSKQEGQLLLILGVAAAVLITVILTVITSLCIISRWKQEIIRALQGTRHSVPATEKEETSVMYKRSKVTMSISEVESSVPLPRVSRSADSLPGNAYSYTEIVDKDRGGKGLTGASFNAKRTHGFSLKTKRTTAPLYPRLSEAYSCPGGFTSDTIYDHLHVVPTVSSLRNKYSGARNDVGKSVVVVSAKDVPKVNL